MRAANKGTVGKQLTDRMNILEQKWDTMRFGEVKSETIKKQHKFTVQIYFNDLDPDSVQVELFADGINGKAPIIQKMKRDAKLKNAANNGYDYQASVAARRPASDYTARIIPGIPNVSAPLEISRILWQR